MHQHKKIAIFSMSIIAIFLTIMYFYKPLFLPIAISFFLSYILNPVVNYFDRFKLSRTFISFCLIMITFFILSVLSIKLAPPIYNEIIHIIRMVPEVFNIISNNWIPSLQEYIVNKNIMTIEEFQNIFKNIGNLQQHSTKFYQAAQTLWETVPKVLVTIVNIILVPILTFFIIKYIPIFSIWSNKIIPKNIHSSLLESITKVDTTLKNVLKGQCLIATTLGILYVIGFYLIGLPSALAIGIIAGICRIIPYMDVVVGGILSIISCLYNFDSWQQLALVAIVFAVIQSIDGLFITPKIIGKKAGLHPIVVILSVFAFGDLMGIWGVLLAVPIVAVSKDIISIILPSYFESDFYKK